ncbi:hypothetical protein [Lactococcus lactis]|uniref:Uncharacterized protein n=1 Tax=Lactococcus lactis TaxID=1358 RepID=A0AAW8UD34_9LACT|nr:hypothetical protein [Lactococcus lactis]MDR7696549.1 hypothetical protein [Lactococcus lactis]MDT2880141.1 hypothetical protein [Lactococcus lactis]MDT2898265.1 hypothetical protein [Lactococcus lactis]MDT2908453.1 hypothetical protein [Lactococcus lactis]MDT2924544.1 hypothetical protein [Lactococcus lactis]
MIQTNTSKKVKEFMKLQQEKINSWNMNVPEIFFSREEKEKIGTITLIIETMLINTRDVLNSINTLSREKNSTGIAILNKTLIENTINFAYAPHFYKESNLDKVIETFQILMDNSKKSMFGLNVWEKATQSFENIIFNNKKTTEIYEHYQSVCQIAHPNLKQSISILKNKNASFNNDRIPHLSLTNDKLLPPEYIKVALSLKDELVQVIDTSINKLGDEVISSYKATEDFSFDICNGILIPSLTEKGKKKYGGNIKN